MILVSLDNLHIHLDDDANSTSSFAILNGTSSTLWSINEAGNVNTLGAINGSSDLNRKENIISIESSDILQKVADLPISQWQFKGEQITHIGPMAQDFYAAFGLGEGETTIATDDADGIALAAIQALKIENDLLKEQGTGVGIAKSNDSINDQRKKRKKIKAYYLECTLLPIKIYRIFFVLE